MHDNDDNESVTGEDDDVRRLRALSARLTTQSREWSSRTRGRVHLVDSGFRVYERDRDAAGTLLGSALALRLFLFFVPLMLTLVGVAGLVGRFLSVDTISDEFGVSGALAGEIDRAFDQETITPWLAIVMGLFGIAVTGRSLSRALVVSSALSWRLGGKQKLRVRSIGIIIGVLAGFGLAWSILTRIRHSAGIAVVAVSFLTVALIYLALWSVLYLTLPRATTDPGAALPGAALIALVASGLQAVTTLYLPNQIASASAIYGLVGIVVALLGWFFIVGRTLAFSFALNAVVFERYGSVSRLVFALPLLRIIPRRSAALARYFDLADSEQQPRDR